MTETSGPAGVVQAAADAIANRRELCALLRREGRHSGVWFADKLTEAADLIADLSAHLYALNTRPVASTLDPETVEAICKRVFLAAHWDGWNGNQCRRDVQHVDAEKSWSLYVSNGALAKTIETLSPGKTGSAGVGEGTP